MSSSISSSSRVYCYLSGSDAEDAAVAPLPPHRRYRLRYYSADTQEYQVPYAVAEYHDTPATGDHASDAVSSESELREINYCHRPRPRIRTGVDVIPDDVYETPVYETSIALSRRNSSGKLFLSSSGSYPSIEKATLDFSQEDEAPKHPARSPRCVKTLRFTWKCTAVACIIFTTLLAIAFTYITVFTWPLVRDKLLPTTSVNAAGRARGTGNDTSTGSAGLETEAVKNFEFEPKRNLPPDGTTFARVSLGDKRTRSVPGYAFWNMQFFQYEVSYVKVVVGVRPGSNWGLYARRDALPTHTRYDVFEVINFDQNNLTNLQNWELAILMETGHWFISLYNDSGDMEDVSFLLTYGGSLTQSCPKRCNENGECVLGRCVCGEGYAGLDCSQRICPTVCNGHGEYVKGQCHCFDGWKGAECQFRDQECAVADCNGKGSCVDGNCVCLPGYQGQFCELGWTFPEDSRRSLGLECDLRCLEHGHCVNGTCSCTSGWNGKFCSMEGCPRNCSSHGNCVQDQEGSWFCRCQRYWNGPDCAEPLEHQCRDGEDDDQDGLVDCEDPDCCSTKDCKKDPLCNTVDDPADVLLTKQPAPVIASFFDRIKFLIEEGSLQKSAQVEAFNENRAAVVRGRIVTLTGIGIPGVRVSNTDPSQGFTLTRGDGWFDLLVNGGGSILLHFSRSPFKRQIRIVNVPWNEILVIDPLVMEKDPVLGPTDSGSCETHDYDWIKPVVMTSWISNQQGSDPSEVEQSILESLEIPGSSVKLKYYSRRSAGYLSLVEILLTPSRIHQDLYKVHLRITVAGNLLEKILEPRENLTFTYAWNKLNIYKQKVYGTAKALIKVGYEYLRCPGIVWETRVTDLNGYDMSISDIGGWNLDIHHRYNFREGILHRGDGSNVYYRLQPRIVRTVAGIDPLRSLDCENCENPAGRKQISGPVSLCAAADGSVFVADSYYIRKIDPDGQIRALLRVNASTTAPRYYMALSPVDNVLYISDPGAYRVIRIRNMEDFNDLDGNWEPVIGSGEPCVPSEISTCGSGGPAISAKLIKPKGIAITADNVIYLADGPKIYMVDEQGIIKDFIAANQDQDRSRKKPLECRGSFSLNQTRFRWPTELRINPLDGSLHILDDSAILRLTPENRIHIVAGGFSHCGIPRIPLVSPVSFSFRSDGDIYVVESDPAKSYRIRRISSNGKSYLVARNDPEPNFRFGSISSVTVTQDGIVYFSDPDTSRVLTLRCALPEPDSNRSYEIYAAETQEIYVFNRYGLHVATRNAVTGRIVYTFTYNVNTSNGKLVTVTDSAGNKISILRDPSTQATAIEDPKGRKNWLKMSRNRLLQEFSGSEGSNVTFEYNGSAGLLKSRTDTTGYYVTYLYDSNGRLVKRISPTGLVTEYEFRIDYGSRIKMVRVTRDEKNPEIYFMEEDGTITKTGQSQTIISNFSSGTTRSTTPSSFTTIRDITSVSPDMTDFKIHQKFNIGAQTINQLTLESSSINPSNDSRITRRSYVNGEPFFYVVYDRNSSTESFYSADDVLILDVSLDDASRPSLWKPNYFHQTRFTYDRRGQLTQLTHGEIEEKYVYDRVGRLEKILFQDGTETLYVFQDATSDVVSRYVTEEGHVYRIHVDSNGYLRSVTTPKNLTHSFAFQYVPGSVKFAYQSPDGSSYKIYFDDQWKMTRRIDPGDPDGEVCVYDKDSRLGSVTAGSWVSYLSYYQGSGLVRSISVKDRSFEVFAEFEYLAGLLKDNRIAFKEDLLHDVIFRYSYDANARLAYRQTQINGQDLPPCVYGYSKNSGILESVNDMRILRKGFNRTILRDSNGYVKITDVDPYARISAILTELNGRVIFKCELEYDVRNRIRKRKVYLNNESVTQRFTYTADGKILEVQGSRNLRYAYDENGNVMSVTQNGWRNAYDYDAADRVTRFNATQMVTYDRRGVVTHRGALRIAYNGKGHLVTVTKDSGSVIQLRYDYRERLTVRIDDNGNVTQYFYGNPHRPDQVTHLHDPLRNRTIRYVYDGNDVLVAMETDDTKSYVVCDESGSPSAIFNVQGSLVKQIERDPFGRIVMDTDPDLYLAIDFHGGIREPSTGLIFYGKRVYDPEIMQWITPDWERLAREDFELKDLFTYRFKDNNPLRISNKNRSAISLQGFLEHFGYSWDSIEASLYTKMDPLGKEEIAGSMDFRILNSFSTPTFVSTPSLRKNSVPPRNYLPRIAFLEPALGKGFSLSRIGGKAVVRTANTGNFALRQDQEILKSLLNDSLWLEILTPTESEKEVLHFVKERRIDFEKDFEISRGFSGSFKVFQDKILRRLLVANYHTILNISYGINVEDPD